MKNGLLILLSCLFALKAFAQANDFALSNEDLGHIQTISRPDCDDALFKKKALEVVKDYLESKTALSSIAKRQKALKLKQIDAFENVDVENFRSNEDFLAASALIEIKINKQIDAKDILLCRQKGDFKRPVYIIAYPYMDNFKAHIIGLEKDSSDYEKLFFMYP